MRKLPPLNALRTFEAAARLTSFSQAAAELCVTHGAISQQIRTLEDYFGRPLFTRSHGKVFLNNAGTELLPVITESLDRIEIISARYCNMHCAMRISLISVAQSMVKLPAVTRLATH